MVGKEAVDSLTPFPLSSSFFPFGGRKQKRDGRAEHTENCYVIKKKFILFNRK